MLMSVTLSKTGDKWYSSVPLEAFSREMAESIDGVGNFAGVVTEMAYRKEVIDYGTNVRKGIYTLLKKAAESGQTTVGTQYELRYSTVAEPVPTMVVRSDVVKKRYPKYWEAARVPTPYARVVTPPVISAAYEKNAAVLFSHDVDEAARLYETNDVEAAAQMYLDPEHQRWAVIGEAKKSVDACRAYLREFADTTGWDGLALTFYDKWSVALSRIQFNADVLALTYPDIYRECAVEVTPAAKAPVLRVVKVGHVEGPGGDDDEVFDDGATDFLAD